MKSPKSTQYRVFVCTKRRHPEDPEGCCQNCGALAIYKAFQAEIKEQNLQALVEIRPSGCLDRCEAGAVALVYQPQQEKLSWLPTKVRIKLRNILFPNKCLYGNLKITDIPAIVNSHFLKGKPLKKCQI